MWLVKWEPQGKLGGQADVKDVAGVWKDLTENVNMMGSNLPIKCVILRMLQRPLQMAIFPRK